MLRRSDKSLIAWSIGSMDAQRARQLSEEAAADPALARRRAAWDQTLAELPPDDPWLVPAPGTARQMRIETKAAAPAETLELQGGSAWDRGGPWEIYAILLSEIAEPETRQIVTLERKQGRWAVAAPATSEDLRPLRELTRLESGAWQDWLLVAPGARPEIAVALPRLDLPIDWEAPDEVTRWAALQRALNLRQVPVATVRLGSRG